MQKCDQLQSIYLRPLFYNLKKKSKFMCFKNTLAMENIRNRSVSDNRSI